MGSIKEIKGNIFETSTQTIVNTVNCVGVMGRGIALEFKNRFPEMFSSYSEMCEKKLLTPGTLQLFTKTSPWILNFPTKINWKFPSKLEYIRLGLDKFTATYQDKKITSIAFPKLGTESGGLEWEEVKALMYNKLEPLSNLDVVIYHYDPNATDSLFDKFNQKVIRFLPSDYKVHIGLTHKQSKLMYESLQKREIKTMMDFQSLRGIGEKAIEKVYNFIRDSDQRIILKSEIEPTLF